MVATVAEAQAPVATPPAVVADRVSKTYRRGQTTVCALESASLRVRDGEFVAVMGPSGSGKSTLLNLLAGLDTPTSGTIDIRGERISSMTDDEATVFRRQHIGVIFQRFHLLPDLTIEENIAVPLMLDGLSGARRRAPVEAALQQLGLEAHRDQLPASVSGGELQRAAIARALVVAPAVLLADEPTGNLDSLAGERVLQDMRRAADDLGRTIVLVTHDPIAAAYADRILRLRDGSFQDS